MQVWVACARGKKAVICGLDPTVRGKRAMVASKLPGRDFALTLASIGAPFFGEFDLGNSVFWLFSVRALSRTHHLTWETHPAQPIKGVKCAHHVLQSKTNPATLFSQA